MINNDVKQELGINFIEYAVACNTDRAIPQSQDGLKPVAKRTLWAALDKTGCMSSKPHVKSAKLVGDIMGIYHPHGDSSIYGALVRLSQSWVMRYPLVDWHGNNGNVMGDGPAAMRYTETRLSKLAEDGMLKGIKKDCVDFIPNYDETTVEPIALPSIFPNLLCNPNSGIGVAMACSWAPHNLKEVATAIFDYMDGKEPMLPGPDFPTGGVVINQKDIPSIMATGHGSVKVRGRYKIEKQNIVFYEIPYGISVEALLSEIGKVCDDKTIEGISDVRDESNKKGIRIVIECEKNMNPEFIANKLFMKTSLQSSFSYNQVALVGKTPTELNLKDCIKIYIEHNQNCIIKEANFDLKKAKDRFEIVNGLLKALEDIDNIISLIKKSKSGAAAKEALIKKYDFTEAQAKAILAMRLSSLAKLESVELNNEKNDLTNQISDLNELTQNEDKQRQTIKDRLNEIVRKYGDARRTELLNLEIPKDKEEAAVVPTDVVVVSTESGLIKKIPTTSFKVQRRGTKGFKSIDDIPLTTIKTNTVDTFMFFSNKGVVYKILVDKIPTGTNTTKGTPISSLINMGEDEKIIAISSLHKKTMPKYAIFITEKGMIKKSYLEEYLKLRKGTGTKAIKLQEGDRLIKILFQDEEDLLLLSKKGFALRTKSTSISTMGRIAMGVKGMKLTEGDSVVSAMSIHKEDDYVAIFEHNGMCKKVKLTEFPMQLRYTRGVIAASDEIAGAAMVDDKDNIAIFGTPNNVSISVKDISLLSRHAMGVRAIKAGTINSITKL